MSSPSQTDLVEHVSGLGFAETVAELKSRFENAGLTLFASIDHAAGAKEVGLDMPPTLLLIYGAARGGTPIMQAYPNAALDLPLKLLVRETTDGTTQLVFRPIAEALGEEGVPIEIGGRLAPAQALLTRPFNTR